MRERPIPDISQDVRDAVQMLRQAYGAELTHESRKPGRQQGDQPVRIYTLRRLGEAQVALRMNRTKTTIYARHRSVAGVDVEADIRKVATIGKRYTGRESYAASSSLLGNHASYLKPAPDNVLLRIEPEPGGFREVFRILFGHPETTSDEVHTTSSPNRKDRRRVSLQALLDQLDRNSDSGRRGEDAAITHEIRRLARLVPPCEEPEKYVSQVSIADVGAGFDIVSSWPNSERKIEVKATTSGRGTLFITENERRVLKALGASGWIYRVYLRADGSFVVDEIQDPITKLEARMHPSVWRVDEM